MWVVGVGYRILPLQGRAVERSRALTPAAMRTDSHKLASHSQRTHSQLHAGPRLHRHRHQAATHRCRAESDAAERTQLQPVDKIVSVKLFFDDDGKPSAHYLARWKVWPVWHCLQLLSVPLWLRSCCIHTLHGVHSLHMCDGLLAGPLDRL